MKNHDLGYDIWLNIIFSSLLVHFPDDLDEDNLRFNSINCMLHSMDTQDGGKDIRVAVDKNQSILKKIQLVVPGFRGYREKEDIRVADELLRSQIGGVLGRAVSSLTTARQNAINFNKFGSLAFIGNTISLVETFQGDIVHGQQGYSGFAPAIQINTVVLDRLYEYDFEFVSKCKEIADTCSQLENVSGMNDPDILASLNRISDMIKDARNAWNQRMDTVEGIKE
ncbi:MAG: hypothetical protein B2I18_03240 [Cuniculiplasma sp. C_DKE]|nr:MAG: hypothetical protein B2I18_03240 [Cuniculiplasma sp. C_DKE]